MKALLKVLAGLVLLLVVALVAVALVFDPNDYKAEIKELARDKASLELEIDGDIGWSLFPTLGLELPQVEARSLDGKPLASLQQARVAVSLTALMQGKVQMSGVLVDGLKLAIVAPAEGEQEQTGKAPAAGDADGTEPAGGLQLDVGNVDIRNADISYEDPNTGRKLVLSDFNFSGQGVVSQQAFPAAMDFRLDIYEGAAQPVLSLETELETRLFLDTASNLFKASGLALAVRLQGDAFAGQTVPVSLKSDLIADLAADSAQIKGLTLSLADLTLTADIDVKQMSRAPQLAGQLQVAAFDLNQLLQALGQAPVETRDAGALKQVAFSTTLAGPANTLGLTELQLQLDDTRFTGEISYDLASGAQNIRLQGDSIDLDRYMPPAKEQPATDGSGEGGAAGGERYPKTPLLPVETLRALNLDAEVGLGQLQASGLKLSELKLLVNAKDGLVKVSKIAAQLYDGSFDHNAVIDARKTPLTMTINKQVSQLQLGGMLQDLADKDLFSGVFNMKGNYRTSGNSVYDIVHSLDGKMDFSVKDGRLKGVNLVDKLCSGILQLQGKTPDASTVADYTEFSNLSGSVNMNDGVLDNRDLKAALVGVNLGGAGQVDLPKEALDYGLSLTILQELKGPNCQIDNKLHNLSFPLRCAGGFDDAPTDMCGPDKAAMKQVLADLGAKEIEEKARAKVEEKKEAVKEKLEEKLKGKFKGLFN